MQHFVIGLEQLGSNGQEIELLEETISFPNFLPKKKIPSRRAHRTTHLFLADFCARVSIKNCTLTTPKELQPLAGG